MRQKEDTWLEIRIAERKRVLGFRVRGRALIDQSITSTLRSCQPRLRNSRYLLVSDTILVWVFCVWARGPLR